VADALRRRLPVLQGSSGGGGGGEGDGHGQGHGEERPPLHWVGFGVVAIFAGWMPLAVGVNALLQSMMVGVAGGEPSLRAQAAMMGLHGAAFALAALAGGFLVGRFSASAGVREARGSGLLAAAIAWGLGISQGAPGGALVWGLLLVLMASLGGGAAHLGGWLGVRRRAKR